MKSSRPHPRPRGFSKQVDLDLVFGLGFQVLGLGLILHPFANKQSDGLAANFADRDVSR